MTASDQKNSNTLNFKVSPCLIGEGFLLCVYSTHDYHEVLMRTAETVYTRDILIKRLSKIRRTVITVPTFYRWLNQVGMTPQRWYTQEDEQLLKRVAFHYATGGTYEELKQQLLEEMDNEEIANQ